MICKILNIELKVKYIRLWLDGISFEKETKYCDEINGVIILDSDMYNYSCDYSEFFDAFNKNQPEEDLHELLLYNGWKMFIGYTIKLSDDKIYGHNKIISLTCV